MLTTPMDVLHRFPVRKTKLQKQAFRNALQPYLEKMGYPVTVEKGSFGANNVVIGDPEGAKYLLTAHYDTCANMIVPNYITPCNFWAFLGYQMLLTIGIVGIAFAVALIPGLVFGWELYGLFGFLGVWLILGLMLFGPANKSNANDNTSGVVTLLEIARTMPENQRHKVCFVLFDLEEAGLIGSASYRKAHKKATDTQIVLNLDCVGEGDHIRFFPNKPMLKNRRKLSSLYIACGYLGTKDILVHEKGFSIYPSDQKHFPYGVGICALNQGKFGLSMGKIHTSRDTTLDETNVNILRAALTTYITCDAVN